jgi:hypothetical protein
MSSKAECEVMLMCIEELAGMSTTMKGYDGFVEVTCKVIQTRNPLLQRALSMQVLHSAIPQWLLRIVTKFVSPLDSSHILVLECNPCKERYVAPSEG